MILTRGTPPCTPHMEVPLPGAISEWGLGGHNNSTIFQVQNYDKSTVKADFLSWAENTRNHIFSKEISQVIIAAMVLAPNFY